MRRPCYFIAMAESPPFRTSLHRPNDPAVRPAWERLLAASPQATAYSHPAFGSAIEEALGLPVWLAAVWEEDRLRAGVLLFEKRRGPFRAAALPPLVPLVTPLLDAPLRETDVHHRRSSLDALLGLLPEAFHQTTLVLHPSLADARPLLWAGWDAEPAYTYRLGLRDQDPVTKGWSDTPKHTLKKEGHEFEITEGEVEPAVALVERSHERQEHALGVGAGALGALARSLEEAGLLRVFVARRGGTAEAGLLVLTDGRTAHYWIAGSVPGPAMTVLTGRVLERMRDDGVAYFDFVGANTPSIAEFKRKFGGTLVPYFRARQTAHPALRLLDRLRR